MTQSASPDLYVLLMAYLPMVPVILVLLVGVIFAFARMHRDPRVAMFVVIGAGMSLCLHLATPIVYQIIIPKRAAGNTGDVMAMYRTAHFIFGAFYAVAFVCLLIAALTFRPRRLGSCGECGHDLSGAKCGECGYPIEDV